MWKVACGLLVASPFLSRGCNFGKSTSRPKNFFLCYFSPPVGRDLFRWVTFRWLPFRYRSPFRRVALPTGRPPDGSPSLRASLAPLNVRRRMRLGRHCRAPPLAVQPSPAPTIRHGGEARRVGAGAGRWADLQASVTSAGPVCGQTNPGGRGEIVVGATQSADKSFFDESTTSVW